MHYSASVPAFPAEQTQYERGISRLDYFAAAALTGLLAAGPPLGRDDSQTTKQAYALAIATIEAIDKGAL